MYPTVSEYDRIIRTKGGNAFTTLTDLQFVPSRTSPAKIYTYGSGTFAVVFKAKENENTKVAIRCFIGGRHDYVNRHKHISEYLKDIRSTWVTKTILLEDEISVNDNLYPVIKMDWVEGQLINDYISANIKNNAILSSLQNQIIKINGSKERKQIGHGDIQCGNVLIDINERIRLIDYDGMYIPDFRGQQRIEKGRPEFQHHKRDDITYNEKIDRFSFWVILCAIEGLKFDKSLWNKVTQGGFNTEENILFTGEDFSDFKNSLLVNRLYHLNQESVDFYLGKLDEFCNSSPDAVSEPILFNGEDSPISRPITKSIPDGEILIKSTPEAFVLNQALKNIGKTPLTLNRSDYLGKQLIISYGEQHKTINISSVDRIKEITFTTIKDTPITHDQEPPINPSKIQSFTVEPSEIRSGKSVTLSWEVENAEYVKIFMNDSLFMDGADHKGEKTIKLALRNGDKNESDFKFKLEAKNQLNQAVSNYKSVKVLKKNSGVFELIPTGIVLLGLLGILWVAYNADTSINNNKSESQQQMADETQTAIQPVQKPAEQYVYAFSDGFIINLLRKYYYADSERDIDSLEWNFRFPIENFFGKPDVTIATFENMVNYGWASILTAENIPDFTSIKVDRDSGIYIISYPLEYRYTLKNGITHLNKYINNIRLNSDGKIYYIQPQLMDSETDSTRYYSFQEFNLFKANQFYIGRSSTNLTEMIKDNFHAVPQWKQSSDNSQTPYTYIIWISLKSDLTGAVYFLTNDLYSSRTSIIGNDEIVFAQYENLLNDNFSKNPSGEWKIGSDIIAKLDSFNERSSKYYILTVSVVKPSRSNLSNNTANNSLNKYQSGTYVAAINMAPILQFPDMVKSQEVGKVKNEEVYIISKYNDSYYYVESGGVRGYLFLGWLK